MATNKANRQARRTPPGSAGNGQVGTDSGQRQEEPSAASQGITWDELDTALLDAEVSNGTRFRICRVWHPIARVHWHGLYGGAPCEVGPASYQTSSGTIVTL